MPVVAFFDLRSSPVANEVGSEDGEGYLVALYNANISDAERARL